MNPRSRALAERIEQGAAALAAFAVGLTDQEWNTVVPGDGRTVGVTVHHVANMYPIEVQLAQVLASGKPIEGVTWDAVADINKNHAHEQASVTKQQALDFLQKNSKAAADAIRAMKDEDLDRAAPVSLNSDAPLTAQFFIEDHALRHSFHHLARIKAALKR
jgi:DinB superfamily